MICFKEVSGDYLIVIVGCVRKCAASVAIAQCPDAGYAGLQLIVNNNVTAPVSLNPGKIETQIARVGNAAGRQKNMRAEYFGRTILALDGDGDTVVALGQRYTFRTQPEAYAFSLQNFTHRAGNIFIFASNQARSHFHNRDFASKAAINLTEFQPDIAASDNHEMFRQEVDIHHR